MQVFLFLRVSTESFLRLKSRDDCCSRLFKLLLGLLFERIINCHLMARIVKIFKLPVVPSVLGLAKGVSFIIFI